MSRVSQPARAGPADGRVRLKDTIGCAEERMTRSRPTEVSQRGDDRRRVSSDGERLTRIVEPAENVLIDVHGEFILSLAQVRGGEIVFRLPNVRIVLPEGSRVDVDRSLVVFFHFIIFVLIETEQGEVIQLLADIGMINAEHLLANLQCTFAQRF